MFAVYHDFSANEGSADFGDEIDAVIATQLTKTDCCLNLLIILKAIQGHLSAGQDTQPN